MMAANRRSWYCNSAGVTYRRTSPTREITLAIAVSGCFIDLNRAEKVGREETIS